MLVGPDAPLQGTCKGNAPKLQIFKKISCYQHHLDYMLPTYQKGVDKCGELWSVYEYNIPTGWYNKGTLFTTLVTM